MELKIINEYPDIHPTLGVLGTQEACPTSAMPCYSKYVKFARFNNLFK